MPCFKAFIPKENNPMRTGARFSHWVVFYRMEAQVVPASSLFRFFCAADSISLMRLSWLTSEAPGS